KAADPSASTTGEAVSALMSGPKDRAAGFLTPPAAGLVADKAVGPAGGKTDAPVNPETVEEAFAPEAAPTADSARSADAAAALARDTGASGLSRAAVEATAQIAAQILRRLEGRSTRFEMALLPEELGRVDIKLDIDSGGRLAARLAFDNPAAATDLRGRVDELRRQLEDAGFHLAEDAFEFAERDSGSSAFDRGQDTRGGSKRAFAAAQRLNAEADAAIPPRWMALSLSPSGVDVKV
ncbi:MAG TPA: flagellar hook-length control protein FliK, partial [Brevundimonas sp.]|nr:flagellar hook-length control protein FliK [Brevundimonas sp.]